MEAPESQVQFVKDHVRARIIRAELAEGARLDAGELRSATGVSVRAVRQALNELSHEGILRRRQRLGTFVAGGVARAGTAPLPAVRSIAILSSATRSGLKRSQYCDDMLLGIAFGMSQPARIEYCVHSENSKKSVDVLPTVDAEVLRSLVQGVIGIEANNSGRLNELARAGLPVVAMDFHDHDAGFDSVYVDHEDAGFQATAHLLALGHRKIALVGERCNPRSSDPTWQQRMSGYLRAMAWAGGESPRPLLLAGPRDTSKLHRDLPEFHRRYGPTAYMLVGGGWAPEFLDILKNVGVHCPRDISLTCADATCVKLGGMTSGTSLSYSRADYEQAGRIAVQTIAARIACRAIPPMRVTIPINFVPGDSSRAVTETLLDDLSPR